MISGRFRSSIPRLHFPLSTLPHSLTGRRGMTRVQVESLLPFLSRTFTFISRQLLPALSSIEPAPCFRVIVAIAVIVEAGFLIEILRGEPERVGFCHRAGGGDYCGEGGLFRVMGHERYGRAGRGEREGLCGRNVEGRTRYVSGRLVGWRQILSRSIMLGRLQWSHLLPTMLCLNLWMSRNASGRRLPLSCTHPLSRQPIWISSSDL